ncbi:hypothetical protein L1277_002236 [Okibacterium sp. HSC-33S16]|nr:hypothetical protein [Okibacterium sp. HSC-33S16]
MSVKFFYRRASCAEAPMPVNRSVYGADASQMNPPISRTGK